MSLRSVIQSPWLYLAWSLVVSIALRIAYLTDPYIFGFTAMILGGISCLFTITGVAVVLLSRTPGTPARLAIIAAIAVAATAIGIAFEVLGTFKWA